MIEELKKIIGQKRIGILGFGLEGQSTLQFIRKHFRKVPILLADRDQEIMRKSGPLLNSPDITLVTGEDYLERLSGVEFLLKSPGVLLPADFKKKYPGIRITSQTAMVMNEYHRQVIGITGTKGKSTTASLIHHLLKRAGRNSILIGNIGIPPFESLDQITDDALIVFELSSHQLEDLEKSPHIAVMLNLYPEHLDRYLSVNDYFRTKWNIFQHQQIDDFLILNKSINPANLPGDKNLSIGKILLFDSRNPGMDGCYLKDGKVIVRFQGEESECCDLGDDLFLKGNHNRMNMMAAILASLTAGISYESINKGIRTFRGLEHRLEYVGRFGGIDFYNDSIATIPEATMEAVQTIPNIATLILGGFDRKLDYTGLIDFLMDSPVKNFLFTGKAGERMYDLASRHKNNNLHGLFMVKDLQGTEAIIREVTPEGTVCLLSPAAASYDSFKNFEERGMLFKEIARRF